MSNRAAQMHLSTAQISELRRDIRNAGEASNVAAAAEVLRYARKYGLRTDTVREIFRAGHKERTR